MGWILAGRHWQTTVWLVRQRPQMLDHGAAERVLALARALPTRSLSAAAWIPREADLGRRTMLRLVQDCRDTRSAGLGPWLDRQFCGPAIGYMPNQTVKQADTFWSGLLQADRQAQATGWLGPRYTVEAEPYKWRWRNSIGHILLSIAQPAFGPYADKQADLELRRVAALLALKMAVQRIAPAQRVEWLAAQDLAPELRERLSLQDGALVARLWHSREAAEAFRLPLTRL